MLKFTRYDLLSYDFAGPPLELGDDYNYIKIDYCNLESKNDNEKMEVIYMTWISTKLG